VFSDVRLALRSLLRAPAFSATTILTLALAAGANAAIFAIVYSVLIKPLPFAEPDRLVAVWPEHFQSTVDMLYTREHSRTLSNVAAVAPGWTMSMTGSGEPVKLTVARVSANLFATLAAEPMLGRTFSDGADQPGSDNVIVLDHAFWMRRFGGDPGVIGRSVQIDGDAVRIVAVMPSSFQVFGLRTDAYAPFVIDDSAWYHRIATSLLAARLAPGVTIDQANSEYRSLTQWLRRERKYSDQFGRDAAIVDLRESLVGSSSRSLLVLTAAVALILLIAGANVGTLQLTRAAARSRDVAIRSALGASRARILRQSLAENAILALAGGTLGVAVAMALLPLLVAVLPADTPRVQEIGMSPAVSVAVPAAAVLVGLFTGLLPAGAAIRFRSMLLLRTMTSSEGPAAKRTRASLVSGEIALAVVLTIGAGLMLQTLWNLQRVDTGFDPDGVLTLHAQPSGARYRTLSIAEYYAAVLDRLRALPGVKSAGAIQHLPFSGYSWKIPFLAEGQVLSPGSPPPSAGTRIVTPGYFSAIGQPILAGRDFESADAARSNVAIVNELLAARFYGGVSGAIGRTIRPRSAQGSYSPLTVVGVVGNVRHDALTTAPVEEVYTSVSEHSINAMMIAVRADGDPLALTPAVREAIWSVDREVPLSDIETMEGKIGKSLGRPRLLLTLLGAFAALGSVLALVGVYGVVAYSVAQRWRELGIMIALGAERARIVRSVLREAALYGAAGLIVGIPAAILAARVLRTLMFGVSPTDARTYIAIACVTMITVVAASMGPALRASRVDPVSALKI
jgi:putative ABC transport system permease protein